MNMFSRISDPLVGHGFFLGSCFNPCERIMNAWSGKPMMSRGAISSLHAIMSHSVSDLRWMTMARVEGKMNMVVVGI